jgi:hypothetical protein
MKSEVDKSKGRDKSILSRKTSTYASAASRGPLNARPAENHRSNFFSLFLAFLLCFWKAVRLLGLTSDEISPIPCFPPERKVLAALHPCEK